MYFYYYYLLRGTKRSEKSTYEHQLTYEEVTVSLESFL